MGSDGASSALAGLFNRSYMLYKNYTKPEISEPVRTSRVGSSRYKSGKNGQFSHRWTFLLGFAHASSVSMLGYGKKANGHITDWKRPSLVFRFPASGSHVLLMTVRSRQCLFVFRYRAIITPFLAQLPRCAASFLVTTPPWQSFSIPEQAMRRVSLFTLRYLNSVHSIWKASLQALDRSFFAFPIPLRALCHCVIISVAALAQPIAHP